MYFFIQILHFIKKRHSLWKMAFFSFNIFRVFFLCSRSSNLNFLVDMAFHTAWKIAIYDFLNFVIPTIFNWPHLTGPYLELFFYLFFTHRFFLSSLTSIFIFRLHLFSSCPFIHLFILFCLIFNPNISQALSRQHFHSNLSSTMFHSSISSFIYHFRTYAITVLHNFL